MGREVAAETLIRRFETDLAALAAPDPDGPRAIVYFPKGYSLGEGLHGDNELLIPRKASRKQSRTEIRANSATGQIAMELLVMAAPDLIIRDRPPLYPGASQAEAILDHQKKNSPLQALIAAGAGHESGPDWACGTPASWRSARAGRDAAGDRGCAMTRALFPSSCPAHPRALAVLSLLTGPAGFGIGESLKRARDRPGRGRHPRDARDPPAARPARHHGRRQPRLVGGGASGLPPNPLRRTGSDRRLRLCRAGAVIALQTGAAAAFALALPLAALTGATIAVLLILMLAGPRGGSLTLILAGIAISALAGALTSLALNLSPNPFATAETVFWMMGSLADRSFSHIWIALPFMALGWALLLPLGRGLDALTLGEDAAGALGIRLDQGCACSLS